MCGPAHPQEGAWSAAVAVGGVVSHLSAASVWDIELRAAPIAPHVTVARNRARARSEGCELHRQTLVPTDTTRRGGVPVTSPYRTLIDLGGSQPRAHALVAFDSALRRRLVSPGPLSAQIELLPTSPRRTRLRELVTLADPLAGSVLETLCRLALVDGGVRPERTQYPVRDNGGLIGRVDFAWPTQRVIVEVDGFAFHADRESYRADRRRDNALLLGGWRVLRFCYEDVVGRPGFVAQVVRQALALGA